MTKIESKYQNSGVSSKTESCITSETKLNIESKTKLNATSNIEEAQERQAFITTAKHNASIMFSKFL
jgi:hypothetical protein